MGEGFPDGIFSGTCGVLWDGLHESLHGDIRSLYAFWPKPVVAHPLLEPLAGTLVA